MDKYFQITLSLPSFGSQWVFGWDELRCLSSSRRSQSLSPSKALDAELLSKIHECIISGSKKIPDDDGDGSVGAVTVFLYLLLTVFERAPERHTK